MSEAVERLHEWAPVAETTLAGLGLTGEVCRQCDAIRRADGGENSRACRGRRRITLREETR